jgi:hypothetical protein
VTVTTTRILRRQEPQPLAHQRCGRRGPSRQGGQQQQYKRGQRDAAGEQQAGPPSQVQADGASLPDTAPGARPPVRHLGQPVGEQNSGDLAWAEHANVELCFTPTNASWANPIEPQFGPLRTFVLGGI